MYSPNSSRLRRAALLPLMLASLASAALAGTAHALPPVGRRSGGTAPRPSRSLPTPAPAPSPAPAGTSASPVKLVDVHATEIEDVCCFGLARDSFFVLGDVHGRREVAAQITSNPRASATGRRSRSTRRCSTPYAPANAAVHLSMIAFDRDAGQILANLPTVVPTIAHRAARSRRRSTRGDRRRVHAGRPRGNR